MFICFQELARQLQEEEGNSEESQVIRDRMLAIEAQDKELAKLLQERVSFYQEHFVINIAMYFAIL